jgi:hypothetical protein
MSKLKLLAAAIGAMGAMAVAGPASAYVYGDSHLETQNLTIATNGVALTAAPTFTFVLTNTATLVGGPVATSATCNSFGTPCGVSPVLDAPAANGTGNSLIRPQNNYAPQGPTATGSWATSDSIITQAELVNNLPTATNQIAESQLNTNGTASANAEIKSNTTLQWTLTLAAGSLTLAFDADPDLRAAINDIPGLFNASVNMNASFSLSNNDGSESVSWSPQGTAANDCNASGGAVACTETADGEDLNRNLGTGTNPSDLQYSFDGANFSAFGINITGLKGGTYSLTLNAVTSNELARVPEPGTIALLGAALAGLGFVGRRKSKQA